MKIYVDGEVYDPNNQLVMVHLSDFDKEQIRHMDKDKSVYIRCPARLATDSVDYAVDEFKKKIGVE